MQSTSAKSICVTRSCKLPDETLHKSPLNAIDERNSILNNSFSSLTPQRRTCWAGRCRNRWPVGRRDASRWSEPKSQNTEEPVTMYGKKDPSRCVGLVGGTGTGWLAEGVHDLAPQYCRPGEPAIANHLIRHEAHNHVSRRLLVSDAGNRSPRTLRRRSQRPFRISLPLPQQSATMTPQRLPHVPSCKKNRTLFYSSGDPRIPPLCGSTRPLHS